MVWPKPRPRPTACVGPVYKDSRLSLVSAGVSCHISAPNAPGRASSEGGFRGAWKRLVRSHPHGWTRWGSGLLFLLSVFGLMASYRHLSQHFSGFAICRRHTCCVPHRRKHVKEKKDRAFRSTEMGLRVIESSTLYIFLSSRGLLQHNCISHL